PASHSRDLLSFPTRRSSDLRFNPAAHKRLILIATIALLDAAFVRWPIHAAWWDLRVAQMCCYPLLLNGPADKGRIQKRNRGDQEDRKSTRLNSSHLVISYAV